MANKQYPIPFSFTPGASGAPLNSPAFTGTPTVNGNPLVATATVTLTAAQVNGGLPFTLVPAPGAGKAIAVTRTTFEFVFGGSAFVDTGETLDIYVGTPGPTTSLNSSFTAAGLLDQVVSTVLDKGFPSWNGGSPLPRTAVENNAVTLAPAQGNTGNTSGGSGSSLKVTVLYEVITL
jgi:hypothetical protein